MYLLYFSSPIKYQWHNIKIINNMLKLHAKTCILRQTTVKRSTRKLKKIIPMMN